MTLRYPRRCTSSSRRSTFFLLHMSECQLRQQLNVKQSGKGYIVEIAERSHSSKRFSGSDTKRERAGRHTIPPQNGQLGRRERSDWLLLSREPLGGSNPNTQRILFPYEGVSRHRIELFWFAWCHCIIICAVPTDWSSSRDASQSFHERSV